MNRKNKEERVKKSNQLFRTLNVKSLSVEMICACHTFFICKPKAGAVPPVVLLHRTLHDFRVESDAAEKVRGPTLGYARHIEVWDAAQCSHVPRLVDPARVLAVR